MAGQHAQHGGEPNKQPLDDQSAYIEEAKRPLQVFRRPRPAARSSAFSFFRRKQEPTAQTAPAPGGDDDPRPEVDGIAFRSWIFAARAKLKAMTDEGPRQHRWPEEDWPPGSAISLVQEPDNASVTLFIRGIRFSNTLSFRELDWPALRVHIADSCCDVVSFSNARLKAVVVWNLGCHNLPGVAFFASNAVIEDELDIRGSAIDPTFSEFQNADTYPQRLVNAYACISANNLRTAQFTVWRVALNGPHYLQHLFDINSQEEFERVYALYADGIELVGASLTNFLAYGCHFHALITLRFASIANLVKFEACYFAGHRLETERYRDPLILDQFDADDFRPLRGMVLDASRAKLGRELVFRGIDPHSRPQGHRSTYRSFGWMNLAHSTTGCLNDDGTLWRTPGQRISWVGDDCRMQFRLNGFAYDALTVLEIGEVSKPPVSEPADDPWAWLSRLRGTSTSPSSDPNRGTVEQELATQGETARKDGEALRQNRARERISWLLCQVPSDLSENFIAQPWTQCGHAFLKEGDRTQADALFQKREELWHRSLRFSKADQRLQAWMLYLWHWLVSVIPGYGYRKWAPFALATAIWLAGWVIFATAFADGFMMQNPDATNEMLARPPAQTWSPREGGVRQPTSIALATVDNAATPSGAASEGFAAGARAITDLDVREKYASYYPPMYSLDLLVPIIEFGQSNYWIPGENVAQQARSGAVRWTPERRRTYLDFVWVWYWVQIALGWYLTTVIVTSLAGLFEREH